MAAKNFKQPGLLEEAEGSLGHAVWLCWAGASMWPEPGWGLTKGWDCKGWVQLSAAGFAASSPILSQGCLAS